MLNEGLYKLNKEKDIHYMIVNKDNVYWIYPNFPSSVEYVNMVYRVFTWTLRS